MQPKWKDLVGHVLSAIAAFSVGSAGAAKLASVPALVANFAAWGFPWWFVYVTGLLEVTGAMLILWPRTRIYGAALLASTMLGAVGTHLSAGQVSETIAPLVLGAAAVAAGVLAWQRQFTAVREPEPMS